MSSSVTHVLERQASDLFRHAWLSDDAKVLLASGPTAGNFLLALASKGFHDDANQCMAFAMPNRTAVWWLCLCLWRQRARFAGPTNHSALRVTVDWVLNPSSEAATLAERASDAAPFDSPARCAANAAFLAGHGPEVDAPITTERQRMVAQLVGGGITLATLPLATGGPGLSPERAMNHGIDVVHGISRWDTILAAHAQSQTSTSVSQTGNKP